MSKYIKAFGESIELYIYEEIFDGVTAQEIAAELQAYPEASLITIHINSPGGSAFDGVTVYNILRASKRTCF